MAFDSFPGSELGDKPERVQFEVVTNQFQLEDPANLVPVLDETGTNTGIHVPEGYEALTPPRPPETPFTAENPAIDEVTETAPAAPKTWTNEDGLRLVELPAPVHKAETTDAIPVSPRKLTFNGLKRAVAAARNLPAAAASRYQTAKFAAGDKIVGLMEAYDKNRHKIYVGIGVTAVVAAVGGLAFGALEAYTTNDLGLANIHDLHHAHEAARQAIPAPAPHHPAEVIHYQSHQPSPNHDLNHGPAPAGKSGAALSASPHLQKAIDRAHEFKKTVIIGPNDGYTQALKKLFPNHTPGAYLSGYKEAIRHYGPNFIRGVKHYRDSHGYFGFSAPGRGHITQAAYQSLAAYFKSHH